MDEKNNRISPFQFAAIGALLGNSLFSGIGISTLLNLAKQDSWMTVIIGFIIGLIPILLLIYIINYKPEKNIFEKNKIIFGKILGSIINLILSLYAFIILLIVIGSSINISETMYLTKTPVFIVAALFVIPAIYAVINGMETIARLSEILFFLAILVVSIIVVSLFYTAGSITEIIDQLKPMFINGPIPVIKNSLVFIGFSLTPWFMLLIIPKNNIINNKKYSYYLIGGYFICSLLMFFVFTLIPGVVTINLAELYRFPAYYVQRKINIGGVLNNVENFLSLHWYFNTFIGVTMSIYFFTTYIKDLFKIKKKKTSNIVTFIVGILGILLVGKTMRYSTVSLYFARHQFVFFISLVLFIIFVITFISVFIRKRLEKKTT